MPRLKKSAPKAAKKSRMHDEMTKFKKGSLKSSSGKKVKSRKQAIAIGLSESGQSKKGKRKSAADAKPRNLATKKTPKRKAANRKVRNKGRQ